MKEQVTILLLEDHSAPKITFLLMLFMPAANLLGSECCLPKCKVWNTVESKFKNHSCSKTHSKCWLVEQYIIIAYSDIKIFVKIKSFNLNKSIG